MKKFVLKIIHVLLFGFCFIFIWHCRNFLDMVWISSLFGFVGILFGAYIMCDVFSMSNDKILEHAKCILDSNEKIVEISNKIMKHNKNICETTNEIIEHNGEFLKNIEFFTGINKHSAEQIKKNVKVINGGESVQ